MVGELFLFPFRFLIGYLKFLFSPIGFVIHLIALFFYLFAIANPAIGIQFSHSDKHTDLAIQAQSCFDDHGVDFRFQSGTNKDKYVEYCLNEDGSVAIRVLKIINGKIEEITKYMKGTKSGLLKGKDLNDLARIVEEDMLYYDDITYISERARSLYTIFK